MIKFKARVKFLQLNNFPLPKSPFSLDFDMIFKGRNIKNFGIEQDKGDFGITGSLSQNKEQFVTSIKRSISPILNPSKPSFNMTGTINTIDLKLFEEFIKEVKLIEGMVDLSIKADCQKGVFDTSKSIINIHMKKLTLKKILLLKR